MPNLRIISWNAHQIGNNKFSKQFSKAGVAAVCLAADIILLQEINTTDGKNAMDDLLTYLKKKDATWDDVIEKITAKRVARAEARARELDPEGTQRRLVVRLGLTDHPLLREWVGLESEFRKGAKKSTGLPLNRGKGG